MKKKTCVHHGVRTLCPTWIASALLLTTITASAQEPPSTDAKQEEGEDGPPQSDELPQGDATPAVLSSDVAPQPMPAADSAPADVAAAEATADDRKIQDLEAKMLALEQRVDAAEMAELLRDEEELNVEQELFRIYGFMDMGIQKTWTDPKSLVSAFLDTNALTFAVGNIDLYFDFNPHADWRGLAEVRFTNAPQGTIKTFGGLGGGFERTNVEQLDPHASALNAPMWGGYTVIERAWIEWKKFQQLRVRVGSFFTPFGIWNVDHGSPTLISIAMPQFIQQKFFPLRQVGVQAGGSFFAGSWELAYRAWLTNGRNELTNLDLNDDKALGGRIFVRKDGGTVRSQFGTSYHHGRVADKVVDITSAPPLTTDIEFESYESWAYVENIIGVDLSLDIGDTRIRSEGTAQLRQYDEGKRVDVGVTSPVPGAQYPDQWRFSVYGLVAHQLPFWGLEPYIYAEVIQQMWEVPDGFVAIAPGLNIRFNPSAQLKFQASRNLFFNWKRKDFPGDPSLHALTTVIARAVLAF